MGELPFELVIEILARVPVKGLLRFRCVCKSWRSMFQDVSFNIKQTTHAPTTMILSFGPSYPRVPVPLSTYTYEGHKLKMILEEPELKNGRDKNMFLKTIVGGHCDGLFCLELEDRSFIVWNPTLREARKVSGINRDQYWDLNGFSLPPIIYFCIMKEYIATLIPARAY